MPLEREPLKGKVFVFTGDMKISRDDAKTKVMVLGGRCTAVPSSKTTFLVAGDNPGPSKMQKAKELGIKVLDEEEFDSLIKDTSKALDGTAEVEKKTEKAASRDECGSASSGVWSEKYRPSKRDEIVGNQGIVKQLEDYLQGRTKYKAVLLSGQPGIGKTTTAHVVCKSLGLNVIEFNASDVRSKLEISNKVKAFVSSQSILRPGSSKSKVLIMDEVDGMSSDRGGIPELISIVKETVVPIICICNDRNNPKIRTLSSYCLDLRFRKPDARQIFSRVKQILDMEGKKIPDGLLNEIISRGAGDIRYTISMVQSIALRKALNLKVAENLVRKNVVKNVFDVAGEVFQRRSISEKIDLYFEDYSLIPLFVSENILKTSFRSARDLSECFDSISLGDVVEKLIRGVSQDWSLAPLHAVYSVVVPTKGRHLMKKLEFPSWLGQNSKHSKAERILHTVSMHSSCKIRNNPEELRKCSSGLILQKYAYYLKTHSIDKAISNIVDYDMTKEDIVGLAEIIPGGADLFKGIERKVKLLLDREYKKLKRRLPYIEAEKIKHDDIEGQSEDDVDLHQED
ncbi:putative DNA replication factor C complex largesubunit [Encephalitozoon cuniculi EcunIII-L]|uniref:Replication factor C subunit 1 n=1 Tax=Encephalitozoon cuniculi TaxID=6035 RepID=M1KJH2_ENCCN|nr:DNA replication factor c subunit [Encephalitozoon cuniculi]KMV66210.1 putative DNA replication factor C complex largesubunit [Encephalitozoon cuniculi EcunIII-L]UYI27951.1 DNA replication factor C subunit [Encephalitozoon cuniculi]